MSFLVGDINMQSRVDYYPSHFSCPITCFSLIRIGENCVKLTASITGLPNIDGLLNELARRENLGGKLEVPMPERGRFNYNFYQYNIDQQDIDWLIRLLRFTNLNFNQAFFDEAAFTEVERLFKWLKDKSQSKPPFQHLVSKLKSPAMPDINSQLVGSTRISEIVDEYLNKIYDFEPVYLKSISEKIITDLSTGTDPNQSSQYKDGNFLDRLMKYTKTVARPSESEKEDIEIAFTDLAVAALVYGLDAFNRRNNIHYTSTLEFAAVLSMWPVYNVIIQSVSQPRPSLKISQESIEYILNDRIYTELPFPDKHIITCVMPTSYLQENEKDALFEVFQEIFEGANSEDKQQIRRRFDDYLDGNKMIEIFYHNRKIIGYNLTCYDTDNENKDVIFYGFYFLIKTEYQQLGLIGYTYPRLGLAIKLYLGNDKETQLIAARFHCESFTKKSHRLFKRLRYHPKHQTQKIAEDVDRYTYKVYGNNCLYIRRGIMKFVIDDMKLKANLDSRDRYNVFDEFFDYLLRGLPRERQDKLNASNRAVPICSVIGEDFFARWCENSKTIGIDGHLALIRFTKLCLQATWWCQPRNNSKVLSYHGSFLNESKCFYEDKRIPVTIENFSIIPTASAL